MKSATMRYFDSGEISHEINIDEILYFISGEISHEICNHEII